MTERRKEVEHWTSTTGAMIGDERLAMSPYFTYLVRNTPRRLLYNLSYHKFAAKMIGDGKRVLEVGCNDGFQTVILAETAAYCLGVDVDEKAINVARETFARDRLDFRVADIMEEHVGLFDAVACFDVVEHVFPENEDRFFSAIASHLVPHGIFIVETPSKESDAFASPVTRAGHVNLYTLERLRETLLRHFHTAFMFCCNDEIVHTGFPRFAHSLIGIGVHAREGATA
ncbi:MAG: class I SAM-dependent methyltransferase [Candidatus Eremiobacteraeota bacterium]|nr:class I SAM-dependent methyltransferase [Candidatus Eremiobacteraeota bacterium]